MKKEDDNLAKADAVKDETATIANENNNAEVMPAAADDKAPEVAPTPVAQDADTETVKKEEQNGTKKEGADDVAGGKLTFNDKSLSLKTKCILSFVAAGVFLALFLVFTALVKLVDVSAVGPEASTVGLSTFNKTIADGIGYNEIWYNVSKILGHISILIAAGMVIYAVVQLIKKRGIKNLEPDVILLGAFYVSVIACYLFFEFVVVNYRPVLMDGVLEASYPSSHTMLALSICLSTIYLLRRKIRANEVYVPVSVALAILALMTVVSRTISGVHWATDIIAAVLLSGFLVFLYIAFVTLCDKQQSRKRK